jgi:hypothetical protein
MTTDNRSEKWCQSSSIEADFENIRGSLTAARWLVAQLETNTAANAMARNQRDRMDREYSPVQIVVTRF